MRLLLVEDNESLGRGLYTGLSDAGYAVDWVRDGETAESAFNTNGYDVAVMDIGLPKKSGIEVLDNLRASGNQVPILLLTAKDATADRIAGLDRGADDYMVKPFDLGELHARLRAIMRRNHGRTRATLQHGDVELDLAAHLVTYHGKMVDLTPKAFEILQVFMENQGEVLSREQLEQTLYSWKAEIDSNAVEVYIHQLRKKLGSRIVRTVRGAGYIMDQLAAEAS